MNYRKIWENINGPIPLDELGRSYEIHHIDGNRKNNNIENLMCISIQDHYDIHKNKGEDGAAWIIGQRMRLTNDEIEQNRLSLSNKCKKPIIDNTSGIVYESSKKAAEILNISGGSIVYKIKKGLFSKISKQEYEKLVIKNPVQPEYKKQKGGDSQKKRIKKISTNVVYSSVTEAAKSSGIHPKNMLHYIKRGYFEYI